MTDIVNTTTGWVSEATCLDLEEDTNYTISVQAFSRAGPGQPATTMAKTASNGQYIKNNSLTFHSFVALNDQIVIYFD